MKKTNNYRITIEDMNTESESSPRTLQFEVQDREDMFAIVDTLRKSSGLNEQFATQVGTALRLLGPAIMQNKKHPLFVDFLTHYKDFMMNLKKTIKDS